MAALEVVAYLAESEVSHAAPKRIAHDVALVGDGLALEVAFLGIGDGFLRALGRCLASILFLRMARSWASSNNPVGLIAELGGDLPVSGQ